MIIKAQIKLTPLITIKEQLYTHYCNPERKGQKETTQRERRVKIHRENMKEYKKSSSFVYFLRGAFIGQVKDERKSSRIIKKHYYRIIYINTNARYTYIHLFSATYVHYYTLGVRRRNKTKQIITIQYDIQSYNTRNGLNAVDF